jgi:hypothetical protein
MKLLKMNVIETVARNNVNLFLRLRRQLAAGLAGGEISFV